MGFKLEHTTTKTPKEQGLEKLLKKEITLFGTFFNSKKKEEFYSELTLLLKAGVHLHEALELLKENQKKEKLQLFHAQILKDLEAGHSLSEIMKVRKEFSEYEQYSIQIGEESGNLIKITQELASFFAQKNEQRRNLVNALTYPIIILSTAILVVLFMLRMVVPMFEDIFKQNGVELPTITRAIISASNFIKDYGWMVLLLLLLLLVARKPLLRNERFRRAWDHFLLKIPYVGHFLKAVYLAQFTQAIALLTASKVPMLTSMRMAKKMMRFLPIRDALNQIENKIMAGESLHQSLKQNKIFDNKMIALVKVAEETNQTEFVFEKLNQRYALEVQQKSKLLSTVMEPLIIVIIGLFVGVILISMYLPMFKLSTVLGG